MSTICHSLTAGGVPLFFMVSGYLLLGRKGTTYKYVAHKIWAIVRYIAAVCILYWIVMALIHWDYAQVKNCASEFVNTFMLRGPFTPFWFLWTMAVIYLLSAAAVDTPFLCASHPRFCMVGIPAGRILHTAIRRPIYEFKIQRPHPTPAA